MTPNDEDIIKRMQDKGDFFAHTETQVGLDGWFNVQQLEALLMWMKAREGQHR